MSDALHYTARVSVEVYPVRRLETESNQNLELLRLLGKRSPEHKTRAEFRRQNGKALQQAFMGLVRQRVKLGLYGKE